MANSGFISMAPAIAAVAAQITTVDGIVDDILEDTGETLPGEHAELAIEHVAIDGIVDYILEDTDITIPAAIAEWSIRGQLKIAAYNEAPGDTDYHDVLNIPAGSGKLVFIKCEAVVTNGNIRVTVDGNVSNDISITEGARKSIFLDLSGTELNIIQTDSAVLINLEYKNSILIEAEQTDGANFISCFVVYQDDS